MLLVYASKTGNTRRCAQKCAAQLEGISLLELQSGFETIIRPCVLLTYTFGFGQVPLEVQTFANRNANLIRGVTASGNRNWGTNFGKSADHLNAQFGFPIIHKFELAGSPQDVARVLESLKSLGSLQALGQITIPAVGSSQGEQPHAFA